MNYFTLRIICKDSNELKWYNLFADLYGMKTGSYDGYVRDIRVIDSARCQIEDPSDLRFGTRGSTVNVRGANPDTPVGGVLTSALDGTKTILLSCYLVDDHVKLLAWKKIHGDNWLTARLEAIERTVRNYSKGIEDVYITIHDALPDISPFESSA